MRFPIYPGGVMPRMQRAGSKSAPDPVTSTGKAVRFTINDTEAYGVIVRSADGYAEVEPCIVSGSKLLLLKGSTERVALKDLVVIDSAAQDRQQVALGRRERPLTEDAKGIAVKDTASGQIVDYKDVTVAGYASTFAHITEADRYGETVMPGAFRSTLPTFRKNPIMLLDHSPRVETLAGRWTTVREDNDGLYVEGVLSQSPEMRHARFLVMEGALKTVSIGGIWFFDTSGRKIIDTHLFEISLVPLPANPDAEIKPKHWLEDYKMLAGLTASAQ